MMRRDASSMRPGDRLSAQQLVRRVRDIPDPEIPVITIGDLGIVREVQLDEDEGAAHVVLTPTYSGCPAMQQIRDHITHAVTAAGWTVDLQTRLSPAWTTQWMSQEGRRRLQEFGIAPPGSAAATASGPVPLGVSVRQVDCPLCGSADTEEVARFGSTACKALRRCRTCREPFDEFKAI